MSSPVTIILITIVISSWFLNPGIGGAVPSKTGEFGDSVENKDVKISPRQLSRRELETYCHTRNSPVILAFIPDACQPSAAIELYFTSLETLVGSKYNDFCIYIPHDTFPVRNFGPGKMSQEQVLKRLKFLKYASAFSNNNKTCQPSGETSLIEDFVSNPVGQNYVIVTPKFKIEKEPAHNVFVLEVTLTTIYPQSTAVYKVESYPLLDSANKLGRPFRDWARMVADVNGQFEYLEEKAKELKAWVAMNRTPNISREGPETIVIYSGNVTDIQNHTTATTNGKSERPNSENNDSVILKTWIIGCVAVASIIGVSFLALVMFFWWRKCWSDYTEVAEDDTPMKDFPGKTFVESV